MKRFGILFTLVAAILLTSNPHASKANGPSGSLVEAVVNAPETAVAQSDAPAAPLKVTTKSAVDSTTHSVVAMPSAVRPASAQQGPPPTLEQVEQQLMSLYIEAGARVERIRVAQAELEQINQSVQQLNAMKAKLTGKAPATAPVAAPQP